MVDVGRAILFHPERLAESARELARRHELLLAHARRPVRKLGPALGRINRVLSDAYRTLAVQLRQDEEVMPAAEWLVDNYYVVREQVDQVRDFLPAGYHRRLPRLKSGPLAGMPRIYELVRELAHFTDNVLDAGNLGSFVRAYQEIDPLSLGELWAVPIMVRFVVLERLSEQAKELIADRRLVDEARRWVDRVGSRGAKDPIHVLDRLASRNRDPGVELLLSVQRGLLERDLLTEEAHVWLDQAFLMRNSSFDDAHEQVTRLRTRRQVSVSNAIQTLRRVGETSWSDFVEEHSVVEQVLRLDPGRVYAHMDFETRNRCRNRVEQLTRRAPVSELQVSKSTLLLAEQAAFGNGSDPRAAQVAWYLIAAGQEKLEHFLGYRSPWSERVRRRVERSAGPIYFSLVAGLTGAAAGALALWSAATGTGLGLTAVCVMLALWPISEMAIVAANWLTLQTLPPRILPKMEFKDGIPDAFRTLVVVPTLLESPQEARKQVEALEIRCLANPDPAFRFVLLSDFPDAASKSMPGDDDVLRATVEGINALNRRHADAAGDRFFLLHRLREWNPSEGVWMGWERKRGKLEQLNAWLLHPESGCPFDVIAGNIERMLAERPIRYVISLDSDTRLPPGSGADLVRAAAHPFNQPRLDAEGRRVVAGYAIIQPRVSVLPEVAGKTRFSRLRTGTTGLDPYTTAVSDIYQDLFAEAIYIGKGIYDVRAFGRVLEGAFPENRILSHDLIESNFARAALCTDIELFDDHPSSYLSCARRTHRWMRGDWQIAPWLFSRVPGRSGRRRNPIGGLGRWKIFDNLRRSLQPVAMLLLLLIAAWAGFGSAGPWVLAALSGLLAPIVAGAASATLHRPPKAGPVQHVRLIGQATRRQVLEAGFRLIVAPHQALVALDAIARSLFRMAHSRRHLLQWVTASAVERALKSRVGAHVLAVGACPLGGAALVVAVMVMPSKGVGLAVIGGLWCLAPLVTWWTSRSEPARDAALAEPELRALRVIARRTWAFFDRFVGDAHRWLPPDNVQFRPYRGEAARTSPTNMGLALVSMLGGYDLGYLPRGQLVDRIGAMLGSMRLLDRHEGHFYNWYDTRTGGVLQPRYVSTVDSGNLAACLIVLRQGLHEVARRPARPAVMLEGLGDTVESARQVLKRLSELYDAMEAQTHHLALSRMLESLEAPVDQDDRAWDHLLERIRECAAQLAAAPLPTTRQEIPEELIEEARYWISRPLEHVEGWIAERKETDEAELVNTRLADLIRWCDELVEEMDFGLLYDRRRDLFVVGLNVDRLRADENTYDLFASEARIASLVAISRAQVPPEHWFRMSRRLTSVRGRHVLVSWGGTMFEYLLPLLFCRRYPGTLLDTTYDVVVSEQQRYGRRKKRPWGISESAYAVMNIGMDYQYRAFGVPSIGLRRGLAEDYVVAPYATTLALLVDPHAAVDNLRRLRKEGAYGPLGFYEAVDYTPSRLQPGETRHVVSAYMAHHQGMAMMAFLNVLRGNLVQRRFHADPAIRAAEPLLQERVPEVFEIAPIHAADFELEPSEAHAVEHVVGHVGAESLRAPPQQMGLLSNGHYTVGVTAAGTGFSRYDGIELTRRQGDVTSDRDGFFVYVKDLDQGTLWSVAHQPVARTADRYDCWMHAGVVQMARVDEWIETFSEICVSPEDNIELRRVTLTNYGASIRRLELTSYIEVVLDRHENFEAHPSFSRLSIQTEWVPEHHAVLARRRERKPDDPSLWMVHVAAAEDLDDLPEPLAYETARAAFIGRGRSVAAPEAVCGQRSLRGAVGSVLDPILSLQRVVVLEPGTKQVVTFGLGMARSRSEARLLADRYDNPYAVDRAFELAKVYGLVELQNLQITARQARRFQDLAAALFYRQSAFRAPADRMASNTGKQSDLWRFGISGDWPLVLVRVRKKEDLRFASRMIRAHVFWRMKGLRTELAILNDRPVSYSDQLQEDITSLIDQAGPTSEAANGARIVSIRTETLPDWELILLETAASLVIPAPERETEAPPQPVSIGFEPDRPEEAELPAPDEVFEEARGLRLDNGFGGFAADGRSYVVRIQSGANGQLRPPMPWSNVIASPDFGFLVTESGSSTTWGANSRENRLTPWSNDPIVDPHGEALYVRDHLDRRFWSPTPGPAPGAGPYLAEHGFGYSRFRHKSHGLDQEVLLFVPPDDSVKLVAVRLRNDDETDRQLDVTYYAAWVLGVLRAQSAPYVVTEWDEESGAIRARNTFRVEFSDRVAYCAVAAGGRSAWTADRLEFLGQHGGPEAPRALREPDALSGRVGAGMDPCAVHQVRVALAPGEEKEIVFVLGEAESDEAALLTIRKYQDPEARQRAFEAVRRRWIRLLEVVRIRTPSENLDVLANGWLIYQILTCRLYARTAFYQSGGAFGFRDQLQDAAALVYARPDLLRDQLLLHARHQFREGDALHWWHPPTSRGVRTRISDDRLWLPYITAHYVERTGDVSVLDAEIPFLRGPSLAEHEEDRYLQPEVSDESATLYEHCCRAIVASLRFGAHGLPLIGTGDWNDGLNLVGRQGRGESVWLGFFLLDVLAKFGRLALSRGEAERARAFANTAKRIEAAVETDGWDGKWYRRAYDDQGEPLGSAENLEARIFALPQAWSVIAGSAPPDRADVALAEAERLLVARDLGLIRLLAPPFEREIRNPGYIKGYLPGVRENGGQYTHGALWLVRAFAERGHGTKAGELLEMIAPTSHARNAAEVLRYQVEPYVVAADIYAVEPNQGRGGWTWYTGSAAWFYRVLLESILGVRVESGNELVIDPSIPVAWPGFEVDVALGESTRVRIVVSNPDQVEHGVVEGRCDGERVAVGEEGLRRRIPLDGGTHEVFVVLGRRQADRWPGLR